MADDPKESRTGAEAKFAKVEKAAQENARAKAQDDAAAHAVREKTSRLRSARLAKEEAEREAEAPTMKSPPLEGRRPHVDQRASRLKRPKFVR
jgi:hypothetical protein